MPDVSHNFGSDLVVSANGDLLTSDSLQLSQESVLRRLLTNPGDYIWEPDYGAGLPAMVGSPINVDTVNNIVLAQMLLEPSVVQFPVPKVTIQSIPNGMFGNISYTETDSQKTATISFPVT